MTQPKQEKTIYFQPGEMMYLISHGEQPPSKKVLDALMSWSYETAKEFHLTISLRPEEVVSFPKVATEMEGQDQSREAGLMAKREHVGQNAQIEYSQKSQYESPIVDDPPAFTMAFASVQDENGGDPEDTRLAEFINSLDMKSGRLIDNSEATLKAVSPNWLCSPTKDWGGTGGPGSRPEPYDGSTPPDYLFRLPKEIENLCGKMERKQRGAGVTVAVLDTAPCLHTLAAAYDRWPTVDPTLNTPMSHGLIETLLKPNGPLTVHPASYEELLRMRSIYLKDHPYPMPDHGLFVAGIIHTIAPAAQIHLYEVLSPDGVGDLKTIATGLRKVLDNFRGRPLVVNCSLMINFPPIFGSDSKSFKMKMDKPFPAWNQVETEPVVWAEHQALSIKWICDALYLSGARVVAAAGNDGKDWDRPQAAYPAAFESVVGVGALRKKKSLGDPFEPAPYSNLADRPAKIGITTLGGEQGENKGVLGIYLGEFPAKSNVDKKDWAWWAGTSFATPIITGVAAAVLSACGFPTTEEAIRKLYESQAFITQHWGEDVLAVEQG